MLLPLFRDLRFGGESHKERLPGHCSPAEALG